MVAKLLLLAAMAAGQFSELDMLFPDLLLNQATGPPSMCGLSADSTEELALAVRKAAHLEKAKLESSNFEVYDTADRMREFVLTMKGNPAHPAVACREIQSVNGELRLTRHMNCSGDRTACNQLFLDFRALDSLLKGVPTDNLLSLPAKAAAKGSEKSVEP